MNYTNQENQENKIDHITKMAINIYNNYDQIKTNNKFNKFIDSSKNQIIKFKLNFDDTYTEDQINSLFFAFTIHMSFF
jgi:hypothetical protein